MLNGITIIDFTNYLPGPFATLRLAEFGASVIKVEAPEGDPARSMAIKQNGEGIVFTANNREKRSIVLNLKEKDGREAALKLISQADAIIESFRPGVMQKLGLDYESVRDLNSGIVYCSLTGYGDRSSMSRLGSHDLNYMALSGALSQLKDSGHGKPVHPTITFADYLGGMAASERILAALLSKERTGKGSYHCISIAKTMNSIMGVHMLAEKETGYGQGLTELNGDVVSYAIYETQDGRYMSLAALEPKFWENFCVALQKPDWLDAHLSKTHHLNPVYVEMKSEFRSRTLKEWTEFSLAIDCCLTPVLEIGELKDFPLFQGSILNNQVRMHPDLAVCPGERSPLKGQHTDEILCELKTSEKMN